MACILVVDDDPHIRELVTALLSGDGVDAIEAVNGRDALAKLGGTRIDLCVLDVMMPEMDGFAFCGHARKYYRTCPF